MVTWWKCKKFDLFGTNNTNSRKRGFQILQVSQSSDLFSERIQACSAPDWKKLVLPPCRVFWFSAADGEAAVLLLDEVLPVAVLDAHPGRLAQLQVEAVRGRRVAGDAAIGHLPVLAVLPLQVHLPVLRPLDLNSGIGGFVALESRGSWALVANEALFTLQHQDWAVDQVEVVLAALLHSVNVGKEVSGLLGPDELAVVRLEGDVAVLQPGEVEQSSVGSSRLSCL